MVRILKDLLSLIMGVVETILTFRFVLKLLGANPQTPFVQWIYDMSAPLLQPFVYMFPTPSVNGGYSLEFTTLFALFAYAFAGYILTEVLDMLDEGLHKQPTKR